MMFCMVTTEEKPAFFEKAEKNRLKKASWAKFCNIIFLFLFKIGSVGPIDQQINFSRLIKNS